MRFNKNKFSFQNCIPNKKIVATLVDFIGEITTPFALFALLSMTSTRTIALVTLFEATMECL